MNKVLKSVNNYGEIPKKRGWQTFTLKGKILNILGFVGHILIHSVLLLLQQPFTNIKTFLGLEVIPE